MPYPPERQRRLGLVALLLSLGMTISLAMPWRALSDQGTGILSPSYARSVAVIVGVGVYRNQALPPLRYARNDARAVAAHLHALGFEVHLLLDEAATRSAIVSCLSDTIAPTLRDDDRVLFFFTGHGDTRVTGDREYGFIIPYDATARTSDLISINDIEGCADRLHRAKHQLYILNSCFGGFLATAAPALPPASVRAPNYIDALLQRRAREVITAGGRNQRVLAEGAPDNHSWFVHFLLLAMQGDADLDGDGEITFAELGNYLVVHATNSIQTPALHTLAGDEGGQFVLSVPSLHGATGSTRPNEAPEGSGAFAAASLSPGSAIAKDSLAALGALSDLSGRWNVAGEHDGEVEVAAEGDRYVVRIHSVSGESIFPPIGATPRGATIAEISQLGAGVKWEVNSWERQGQFCTYYRPSGRASGTEECRTNGIKVCTGTCRQDVLMSGQIQLRLLNIVACDVVQDSSGAGCHRDCLYGHDDLVLWRNPR